jgi:TPR repeat protein
MVCIRLFGLLALLMMFEVGAWADELAVACAADDAVACYELGLEHQNAVHRKMDEVEAFKAFERACELGSARGCGWLGWAYYNANGVFEDRTMAMEAFSKGCELGGGVACSGLGYLQQSEGSSQAGVALTLAHERLPQECQQGDEASCLELAWLTHKGIGVSADFEAAVRIYAESCERGALRSCDNLAQILSSTSSVRSDVEKAVALFEDACEAGYASSCNRLGVQVQNQGQTQLAMTLFQKACQEGCDWGCYNFASFSEWSEQDAILSAYAMACDGKNFGACQKLLQLAEGDDALRLKAQVGYCEAKGEYCTEVVAAWERAGVDERELNELLHRACQRGSEKACEELAFRAVNWVDEYSGEELEARLRESCLGSARACSTLGLLYLEGKHLAQSDERARSYLAQGCVDRGALGCFELGELVSAGRGGEVDALLARQSWNRACSGGVSEACLALGYACQAATPPLYPKAKRSFEAACVDGNAEACRELGLMHLQGHAAAMDSERAAELLTWACQEGDAEACAHELSGTVPARGVLLPKLLKLPGKKKLDKLKPIPTVS